MKGGDSVSHIHNIIDTDCRFTINPITRTISTRGEKLSVVQYDHDSERFTFQMQRYVEEHDMINCNRVEIHYTNITRNKKQENSDVYIVSDLDKGTDLDTIFFSWLVSRNATQLVGTLKFSITFICLDEDGNESYKWSTDIFDGIQILAKLENTELVIDRNPDAFERIKQEILGSIPPSGGEVNPSDVEKIVKEYLEANPPAQGEDGDDGVSPTISVIQIDTGYSITITDANGPQTVELKNGKDGYTPVKGVDYFTDEDILEVAQEASKLVSIEQVTPEQVVFPNGANTTYAIGKVVLENGSGVLVEPGGTLADFFNQFVDEKNPTTTDPSVTITSGEIKAYEVGTTITPSYSAKFDPGSYTYGPSTGVTVTAWEISDTDGNTSTNPSGSLGEVSVATNTSYKITAKATHTEGAIPKTNTGKDYEAGKIAAGTKSASTSAAITGYRNSFYGILTAKNDLTSDIVRSLTKSGKALSNGSSFSITIPVGALRVVIAYPSTLRDLTSVKDVNGMSAEISSSFAEQTLAIEGANKYQSIDYKVYTLDFADPIETANKFTVTI